MEGRSALCFLVVLALLASPTLAEQKCYKERFYSMICMKWHCAMECVNQSPELLLKDAHCTTKHVVMRYCNCEMCTKE
ncbi:hypothetical protein D1007_35314 [Hordeum vulgare]|nr:hypothetical protein D1007_35314 [Hordeum vulgare]KAI4989431.1 hypothetical protein ZWY2020_036748 [Hordeum vulgare]